MGIFFALVVQKEKVKAIWINTRTEFTFGAVFGHLDEVAAKLARYGSYGGICDSCNTFGHIRWMKACKKAGIKPIYGVSIPVADDITGIRAAKNRRYSFNEMTFIAKNADGLAEIYELTDLAHLQFYWRPVIDYTQVNTLSENVFILSGVSPQWDLLTRTVYQELSTRIPHTQRNSSAPPIACIDNYYPEAWDTDVYEPFADDRKRERKTTPQHILSPREWLAEFPDRIVALQNLKALADQCNVDLPFAPMVKYIGKDCIEKWCAKGAKALGVDITSEGEYKARYEKEMELIKAKDYVDYFLVTADLIRHAKKKMAVGPARGSSAGSLVCYLMGITTIDPLEYDLYFERFIDVNRFDLPDIDVDFQDNKRHMVLTYLKKKYGIKNVAQLGNVNRLKPKSAITRFAKALRIPLGDVEEVKDAIMERSGGDARANQCMADTLAESDIGKKFLSLHPNMLPVTKIEAHASHTGIHAAAIIVCNEPITKYSGINSRDKGRIAMIDKKDAEVVNLLKIDALGLRTMSILAGVCDQLGKHYDWLYEIPTDDQATFDVFNAGRLDDIFQFSGPAIKGLAKQMPIDHMEDIAALSALGRPGPLSSGGANLYIQYRTGAKEVEYLADHPAVVAATKATYGVVIYQEQMLAIGRNYGCLSWGEVSELRKAASKSLGDEFFGKYKAKFVEGALSLGEPIESIEKVWKGINTMGCLSGDTILKNPFPNHATPKEITLRELCENEGFIRKPDTFVNGPRSDSKARKWSMMKKQNLYCLQGEVIKPARLIDVFESGVKTTYRMVLETGEEIRATANHKFFDGENWIALEDLSDGSYIATMGKRRKGTKNKPFKGTGRGAHNDQHGEHKKYNEQIKLLNEVYSICQVCLTSDYQETHHKDGNRNNSELDNLLPVCRKCHKAIHREKDGERCIPHLVGKQLQLSKIIFIGSPKEEMTYDISMPDPYHNFIANNIVVHNSWAFNKSHAVSYGLVSYLCGYMKAHYPLEFLVANLNNSNSDSSALKILRDAVEHDGIKYEYINPTHSEREWSVKDGILYGGLVTVHGIGVAKANKFLKCRREGDVPPKGIQKSIAAGITPFKYLYPGKELYGDYYDSPEAHGLNGKVSLIKDCQVDGTFTVIGKMIKKNTRDGNEQCFVSKRGGEYLTGETTWINIILEDDTDSMMVKISTYDYERMGKAVAETGKEDKDWYMVHGTKKNGWNLMFVKNIRKITRSL